MTATFFLMATSETRSITTFERKGCRCHLKFENFSLFIIIDINCKVFIKYRFNGNLFLESLIFIGRSRLPLRLPLAFSNGNLFAN